MRLKEASPEREFELRARSALSLPEHHRNAVRAYTAPEPRRGFVHEALLSLGLPADTAVADVEVRGCVSAGHGGRGAAVGTWLRAAGCGRGGNGAHFKLKCQPPRLHGPGRTLAPVP
jgi:hypothetical protein